MTTIYKKRHKLFKRTLKKFHLKEIIKQGRKDIVMSQASASSPRTLTLRDLVGINILSPSKESNKSFARKL